MTTIIQTHIQTPLGPLVAGAVDDGICLLDFSHRPRLDAILKRLTTTLHADLVEGDSPHLSTLATQVDEYFAGTRRSFDLPLVMTGTDFQQSVWRELLNIPYGTTRTYQEQAEALGKPGALRAVARANGENCLAILLPCHRVVGKDGSLTGYSGGVDAKRRLLRLEARTAGAMAQTSLFE